MRRCGLSAVLLFLAVGANLPPESQPAFVPRDPPEALPLSAGSERREPSLPPPLCPTRERSRMSCSSSSSDPSGGSDALPSASTVRILALHGKGGDGPEFRLRLAPLAEALSERVGGGASVTFDCPSAPFELGDDSGGGGGRAWWTLPPGVRSFNADEYLGFEESAAVVREALMGGQDGEGGSVGGYDFVLGHSQGAILLSALLARGDVPPPSSACVAGWRPPRGYIFNGAAWPNPFSSQMNSWKSENGAPPSLFVIGASDRMNPPEGARRVRDALARAGMSVETCDHPGGHSVPVRDGESLERIVDWLVAALSR